MITRICTECSKEYPATVKFFHRNKTGKYGLRPNCKWCERESHKRYYSTLGGHLHHIYYAIRRRCNNSKVHNYNCYGGRGIKCKFISLNSFRNYIKNGMGIVNIGQIEGLQIDRIDNNGHYEPGNIRFVTPKENSNNRRSKC